MLLVLRDGHFSFMVQLGWRVWPRWRNARHLDNGDGKNYVDMYLTDVKSNFYIRQMFQTSFQTNLSQDGCHNCHVDAFTKSTEKRWTAAGRMATDVLFLFSFASATMANGAWRSPKRPPVSWGTTAVHGPSQQSCCCLLPRLQKSWDHSSSSVFCTCACKLIT